jgi:hypothetical protein
LGNGHKKLLPKFGPNWSPCFLAAIPKSMAKHLYRYYLAAAAAVQCMAVHGMAIWKDDSWGNPFVRGKGKIPPTAPPPPFSPSYRTISHNNIDWRRLFTSALEIK